MPQRTNIEPVLLPILVASLAPAMSALQSYFARSARRNTGIVFSIGGMLRRLVASRSGLARNPKRGLNFSRSLRSRASGRLRTVTGDRTDRTFNTAFLAIDETAKRLSFRHTNGGFVSLAPRARSSWIQPGICPLVAAEGRSEEENHGQYPFAPDSFPQIIPPSESTVSKWHTRNYQKAIGITIPSRDCIRLSVVSIDEPLDILGSPPPVPSRSSSHKGQSVFPTRLVFTDSPFPNLDSERSSPKLRKIQISAPIQTPVGHKFQLNKTHLSSKIQPQRVSKFQEDLSFSMLDDRPPYLNIPLPPVSIAAAVTPVSRNGDLIYNTAGRSLKRKVSKHPLKSTPASSARRNVELSHLIPRILRLPTTVRLGIEATARPAVGRRKRKSTSSTRCMRIPKMSLPIAVANDPPRIPPLIFDTTPLFESLSLIQSFCSVFKNSGRSTDDLLASSTSNGITSDISAQNTMLPVNLLPELDFGSKAFGDEVLGLLDF